MTRSEATEDAGGSRERAAKTQRSTEETQEDAEETQRSTEETQANAEEAQRSTEEKGGASEGRRDGKKRRN
jgi:hypothetical protein